MRLYVLCYKMRKGNDEDISEPILERRRIVLTTEIKIFSKISDLLVPRPLAMSKFNNLPLNFSSLWGLSPSKSLLLENISISVLRTIILLSKMGSLSFPSFFKRSQ